MLLVVLSSLSKAEKKKKKKKKEQQQQQQYHFSGILLKGFCAAIEIQLVYLALHDINASSFILQITAPHSCAGWIATWLNSLARKINVFQLRKISFQNSDLGTGGEDRKKQKKQTRTEITCESVNKSRVRCFNGENQPLCQGLYNKVMSQV